MLCMDSSLLPEDGGGDPTREAVIAKSFVNRGHPSWTMFENRRHSLVNVTLSWWL